MSSTQPSERERPVVLLTGASGNVGQAIAHKLAADCRLVLFDRRACSTSGLSDAALHRTYGGIDLADEAQVRVGVEEVRAGLGNVAALVHTVGGYAGGIAVQNESTNTARRMLELNYLTAITMVQAVLPHFLAAGGGTIVLFGSADALKGRAGNAMYGAAKAALVRFAEAFADEVADRGIRVRVILPTTIDTPINRQSMPHANFAKWVTPAQIADCVGFLISDAAAGIAYATVPMGR
jgi:NADP-dependent 3-hydroxy acid dehydrogenase YdfG